MNKLFLLFCLSFFLWLFAFDRTVNGEGTWGKGGAGPQLNLGCVTGLELL